MLLEVIQKVNNNVRTNNMEACIVESNVGMCQKEETG